MSGTRREAHPGDSAEQREAEALLIAGMSKRLGVSLAKDRLELPNGGWMELDGVSDVPPVLCEAWAHLGPAKGGQKHKLLADALKLLYASQFFPGARKIIVLADKDAARHLQGRGWMAGVLKAFRIEVRTVSLPKTIRAKVQAAQRRQVR